MFKKLQLNDIQDNMAHVFLQQYARGNRIARDSSCWLEARGVRAAAVMPSQSQWLRARAIHRFFESSDNFDCFIHQLVFKFCDCPPQIFSGKKGPYPAQVKHAQQTIAMDKWIEFEAAPRVGVLFVQLRQELDKLLLQKLANPSLEIEHAGRTVDTIVQLLQEEEGIMQAQDA